MKMPATVALEVEAVTRKTLFGPKTQVETIE